jgi:hypothetical protein
MAFKLNWFIVFWCITDLLIAGMNVSVGDPFLLRTVDAKITAIENDFENTFLVGFSDGQV